MKRFKQNLVLKSLKKLRFPPFSYVGHVDCLACKSIQKKEKDGETRRPDKDLILDIAVNVSPCLSMFPIYIVAFCRFTPCCI